MTPNCLAQHRHAGPKAKRKPLSLPVLSEQNDCYSRPIGMSTLPLKACMCHWNPLLKASLDVCKYMRLPRNGTTWLGNFIGILPHNTWKKKMKAFLLSESSWLVLSPHLHARTVFESVLVPLKSSCWKSLWTYASMYEYLAMTPNCFATSWECSRQTQSKKK